MGGSPPPPCKVMITEWKDFYEKVILSNGGKILLQDSKAVCAIAGIPCVSIIKHGQTAELNLQNFKNANESISTQINPLASPKDINEYKLEQYKKQKDGERNK